MCGPSMVRDPEHLSAGCVMCRSKSPKPLPLVKFIDTFEAAFGLIANNGSIWTINTDLEAPRSK